jgi:hypothetical protein
MRVFRNRRVENEVDVSYLFTAVASGSVDDGGLPDRSSFVIRMASGR